MLSTAYNMVCETLCWLETTVGIQQVVVPILFPLDGPERIIQDVEQALASNPNIKLAVFSHISSMPSLIEPVTELSKRCRAHGVTVLVDGAHAPGILEIDVQTIDCDYYCGNLHKWCFAPKGTAFLWTAPERQRYTHLQPTVISSTGEREYLGRFAYTGTRDYTAFAVVPAALAFYSSLGGHDAVYNYNHTLIVDGAKMCAAAWGTGLLCPDKMIGYMANVFLPTYSKEETEALQEILDTKHNVYIVTGKVKMHKKQKENLSSGCDTPSSCEAGEERYYTRLSAQVYLTIDDFCLLCELVP